MNDVRDTLTRLTLHLTQLTLAWTPRTCTRSTRTPCTSVGSLILSHFRAPAGVQSHLTDTLCSLHSRPGKPTALMAAHILFIVL